MTYHPDEEREYEVVGEQVRPEPERGEEPEIEEESEHELYMEGLTQMTDEDREQLFSTEGITDVGEEDDLSDLVDVDMDDVILGEDTEPEPPKRYKIARPGRRVVRREPPPTSLGGTR